MQAVPLTQMLPHEGAVPPSAALFVGTAYQPKTACHTAAAMGGIPSDTSDAMGSPSSGDHLKQNLVAQKDVTTVLAQTYKPGEKLMIDFAGATSCRTSILRQARSSRSRSLLPVCS